MPNQGPSNLSCSSVHSSHGPLSPIAPSKLRHCKHVDGLRSPEQSLPVPPSPVYAAGFAIPDVCRGSVPLPPSIRLHFDEEDLSARHIFYGASPFHPHDWQAIVPTDALTAAPVLPTASSPPCTRRGYDGPSRYYPGLTECRTAHRWHRTA